MSTIRTRARRITSLIALTAAVAPVAALAAQGSVQPNGVVRPTKAPPSGKFRVLIRGFKVDQPSRDHIADIDGVGDEVFLSTSVIVLDSSRGIAMPASTIESAVFGEARVELGKNVFTNRHAAGSGTPRGGLRRSDTFPRGSDLLAPDAKHALVEAWCGTLVEGQNAAVIVPAIWEWDGVTSNFKDWMGWASSTANTLVKDQSFKQVLGQTGTMVANLATLGIGAIFSMADVGLVGGEADRPIGTKRSASNPKTLEYTPTSALVVNYRTADFSTRPNAAGSVGGQVPGIYQIQFADDPSYNQGRYTVYLQVQRIDGQKCRFEQ
jgi:hypothetical protein